MTVVKLRQYVVRIVIPTIENHPPLAQKVETKFLECLDYAGLIALHKNNEEGQCFDLVCPPNHGDSKNWSESVANWMKRCGYNAVSAPST